MDTLRNKKLLIYGTGAIGGYYGAMLVKAGFDVTFIARGKNYEVMKEKGLTFIHDGEREIIPVNVVRNCRDNSLQGEFDYIFICVKARDTKNAIREIKFNVGENTSVVSFQNGVENEEIIGSVIGEEKVIGANLYVNSWLVEPGVVEVLGSYYIKIGALDGIETKQVKDLQKIFELSGINCQISPDITADLWHKLVWNAAVNPVSVLTKKTLDEMLDDAGTYNLIKGIMQEVRDTAIANGINIRRDTVEYNLECVKNYKKGIITSMLQDFEAGKPIELEEIVGVVVRKAKGVSIPVPNIENVYNKLSSLVNVCA